MVSSVDSITAIRAFVAAAEAGGFKQGGISLGLTSSAVGKAIARLEHQLGVQLFHRTTRTLSLTEPGALLLVRAKRILIELEEAEAELQSSATELRGGLRVGLPLSADIFGKPLADFSQRYPCVQLELEFSDRMVDVIAEGFDVVIRTGGQSDSRLMQQKLGDFTWCLAASPLYLEHAGTPQEPEELIDHVCLRQRLSTGRIAPWPLLNDKDLSVPVSHSADIIDPILDMVLAGAGIASFPTFIVHRHFAEGRLVEILPGQMQRDGVMNLIWPSGRYQSPKTRAFVDFMRQWAQSEIRP
ncbi:LysR family transcriptional regulator [Novosphingobium profundi]|uniref:LysR family transcriptional regulator n=1 Tax=Novosphingobium profundi TaxID=1774954 RepID=UPI001CFD214A|nr:LysR family transcriptional regulator [Novosphingobium profundi]